MGTDTTATPPTTRKINETPFTMEDVREVIKQQQIQKEQSGESDIVGIKQDILSHQPITARQAQQQKVKAASIADILGFNPHVSKKPETNDKDPSKISAKYRKYYKMLLKLKEELQSKLDKSVKKGKAKDDPELAKFDVKFALSLLPNEKALIEIEQAIQRIYDGTYGICEVTGKPIESKRLEAVPFARCSLEGQETQEKQQAIPDKNSDTMIFDNEQHDDIGGFTNYEEE